MLRLGVLASGRGSNLQSILDKIDSGALDAQVVLVLSDNPNAKALERAQSKGIKAIACSPKNFSARLDYENSLVEHMRKNDVEMVVLAGYMRIVKAPLLEAYPNKVINIHPALLPSFPGLDSQKQALDYGVKITGCTVHFIDAGVDTGPIILQKAVPVLDGDTEETLSARILKEEHKLFPQTLQLISQGKVKIQNRKVLFLK